MPAAWVAATTPAGSRDSLQCVLADLSNKLSYAGRPVCTVTTASDTHSKVTSRTSGGLACVHADVYRLANIHFLQAILQAAFLRYRLYLTVWPLPAHCIMCREPGGLAVFLRVRKGDPELQGFPVGDLHAPANPEARRRPKAQQVSLTGEPFRLVCQKMPSAAA